MQAFFWGGCCFFEGDVEGVHYPTLRCVYYSVTIEKKVDYFVAY